LPRQNYDRRATGLTREGSTPAAIGAWPGRKSPKSL
jgi:hypothetical protein